MTTLTRRRFVSLLGAMPFVGPALLAVASKAEAEPAPRVVPSEIGYPTPPHGALLRLSTFTFDRLADGDTFLLPSSIHNPVGMACASEANTMVWPTSLQMKDGLVTFAVPDGKRVRAILWVSYLL